PRHKRTPHATAKALPSTRGGRGFVPLPLAAFWSQPSAFSLQPSASSRISAFRFPNFRFSTCSRALLSATIWRPIRLSSRRISARRYCRPDHKCTARSRSTPTPRQGPLLIVPVTLMVSFLFAAVHLPAAAVPYGSPPPYQTSHPPVLTNNRGIRAEIIIRAGSRFRSGARQFSCDILVTILRRPANLFTDENSKTLQTPRVSAGPRPLFSPHLLQRRPGRRPQTLPGPRRRCVRRTGSHTPPRSEEHTSE